MNTPKHVPTLPACPSGDPEHGVGQVACIDVPFGASIGSSSASRLTVLATFIGDPVGAIAALFRLPPVTRQAVDASPVKKSSP